MKKQTGFTLIELMVVMAIIAILATAGLSAYTGYIKKARDATRIADLAAINTIVLASITTDGLVPEHSDAGIIATIKAANNGKRIVDPMTPDGSTVPASVCLDGQECYYFYAVCDGGTGYALIAFFESESNRSRYAENASGYSGEVLGGSYDIGSCTYVDEINESWALIRLDDYL